MTNNLQQKIIQFAKERNYRMNWKHTDAQGNRLVPSEVSTITMTVPQIEVLLLNLHKEADKSAQPAQPIVG